MDWKHEHPQYERYTLEDNSIPPIPWILWEQWQEEASHVLRYTNEIALATADVKGHVSVRMVLLKHSSEQEGFCWYTNRESEKGRQLTENPFAELLWYNKEHQRQVRIRGNVTELNRDNVCRYAQSRPFLSQVSAYVSEQSAPIESKNMLIEKFDHTQQEFSEKVVPVKDSWVGFSLQPQRFEFWQGNTNRLHDRIVFTYNINEKSWTTERLQP